MGRKAVCHLHQCVFVSGVCFCDFWICTSCVQLFVCVCVFVVTTGCVCQPSRGAIRLIIRKGTSANRPFIIKTRDEKKGIRGGEHNTREQTRAPSNGQESISRNKNYKINRVPHTNKTHSSINYTLSLCAHKVQLNTGQQTSASISTRGTARTDSSHPRNIVKACVCVPAATD